MIKSDAQRERTVAQIEGFKRALAKVEGEKPGKRTAAIRGSYEGMIRQLEDELRDLRAISPELPSEFYDSIAGRLNALRLSEELKSQLLTKLNKD